MTGQRKGGTGLQTGSALTRIISFYDKRGCHTSAIACMPKRSKPSTASAGDSHQPNSDTDIVSEDLESESSGDSSPEPLPKRRRVSNSKATAAKATAVPKAQGRETAKKQPVRAKKAPQQAQKRSQGPYQAARWVALHAKLGAPTAGVYLQPVKPCAGMLGCLTDPSLSPVACMLVAGSLMRFEQSWQVWVSSRSARGRRSSMRRNTRSTR